MISRVCPILLLGGCLPAFLDFDDPDELEADPPSTTTFVGPSHQYMRELYRAGDLDGDGIDDAVLAQQGDLDALRILYGRAGGWPVDADLLAETVELVVPNIGRIRPLGDVDGDGTDELMVDAYDEARIWLLWGSTSRVEPGFVGDRAMAFEDAARVYGVSTLGDLDGSGAADLVVARHNGSVQVYLDPELAGAGEVVSLPEPDVRLPTRVQAADVATADLDGDGANELIVDTLRGIEVRSGADPAAGLLWWVDTRAMAVRTRITVADRDGDGATDLAFADISHDDDRGTVFGFDGGQVRSGQVAAPDWIVAGAEAQSLLGTAIAFGEPGTDLDGLALLGSPWLGDRRGAAFLVDPTEGSVESGLAFHGAIPRLDDGKANPDESGSRTALGDFDGDGRGDALISSEPAFADRSLLRFYGSIAP